MYRKIKPLIFTFLLLLYLYSVKFVFFPFTLKQLFGGIGLFFFLINNHRFSIIYLRLSTILIILFIWSFISQLLNGTNEYLYHTLILSFFMNFFASYFLFEFSKNVINSINDLFKYIIYVVILQSFLILVFYSFPSFHEFINSLENIEAFNYDTVINLDNVKRLTGIGTAKWFGILSTSSLAMIISMYMIIITKNIKKRFFYVFSFLIISTVSYFVARTTIILFILSIIMLMVYILKHRSIKLFFTSLFISIFSIIFIYIAINYFLSETIYNWAFDFLINKQKDGVYSNGTIDVMEYWLSIINFEFKTFIIGDGRFKMGELHYYKEIDIGFFRTIYYSGIVGLYLYLLFHYKLTKNIRMKTSNSNSDFNIMLLFLFICFLVIFAKGYLSMIPEFILLLTFIDYGKLKIIYCE